MTTTTDHSESTLDSELDHNGDRKYPQGADIVMASKEDSERFYFQDPVGGIMSVPALNVEQAREMAADEFKGFSAEDFVEVDGFDAETRAYPDPVDSDRDVNEYDLWSLHHAQQKGARVGAKSYNARKNPTEYTIKLLLAEWDDPSDVPLHGPEALQQATGIGPHRAEQIIGAAVANRLIERPVRAGGSVTGGTNA